MQDNYSGSDPLIGKTLGGKYEIVKKIGAGGMATVYKATQVNLGREVALKIIHPNLVNDSESIARFYREARDLAALQHPNIVTVFDFGTEDGFHFISMEYLKGKNLSEVIRREGQLDELKIVKYIAPIADAINHLHEKGLIHRDIKSSNIFISSNDRAVLMDFGIAYHQDKTISIRGSILGTAEFMSPEQAKGEPIDGRSDIYSLGVVMYESITGRVPFYSDNSTATLYKVVHELPPPISPEIKVSEILKNLVFGTLEKEKLRRPQEGSEIYDVLNSILSTSEINRRAIKSDSANYGSVTEVWKGSGPPSDDVKKTQKIKEKEPAGKEQDARQTSPGKTKSGKKVLFIVVPVIVILIAAGAWLLSPGKSKKYNADTGQLTEKANQAYNNNDFIMAHNYFLKVFEQDTNNIEIRQKMTECLNGLFNTYINPNLVSVPGGFFEMGNNSGGEDEKPRHKVSLSPFLLNKTEITNQQFAVFLNAFACSDAGSIEGIKVIDFLVNNDINVENGIFKTRPISENLPVTGVSWYGANLFCKAFSGRLPTEAEWEYSAQAGQNFSFSGSDEIDEIAWFSGNSEGRINKVASKKPNAFGLYDLSGNAWEWCDDFYDKSYYQKSGVQNPRGPKNGETKVIRGGDFACTADFLYNSFRSNANLSGSTTDAISFRICIPSR